MKVREVMMRAWARKITWFQAAEIVGLSDRHLRRIREGYEKFGYFSLLDRRRGQPSPKRMPVTTVVGSASIANKNKGRVLWRGNKGANWIRLLDRPSRVVIT